MSLLMNRVAHLTSGILLVLIYKDTAALCAWRYSKASLAYPILSSRWSRKYIGEMGRSSSAHCTCHQLHSNTRKRWRRDGTGRWRSKLSPLGGAEQGSEGQELNGIALSVKPWDQCGEICAKSSTTVCVASGCGVSFTQCERCNSEHEGYCSVACQLLVHQGRKSLSVRGVNWGEKQAPSTRLRPSPGGRMGDRVQTALAAAAENVEADIPPEPHRRDDDESAENVACDTRTMSHEKDRQDELIMPQNGGDSNHVDSTLENYAAHYSSPESCFLTRVRESTTREQPRAAHMVSGELQGEFLKLVTWLSGAKRVLDIGTFTGYSAIAFAEALPEDGVVVTLESDKRTAERARAHFSASPVGDKITLVLGEASSSIKQLMENGDAPFDVIFMDADKKGYWDYYEKLVHSNPPLLAPHGVLLADNVLFHGMVPLVDNIPIEVENNSAMFWKELEASAERRKPRGDGLAPSPRRLKIAASLHEFNKRVQDDERVEVLIFPLRDGLSIIRRKDSASRVAEG